MDPSFYIHAGALVLSVFTAIVGVTVWITTKLQSLGEKLIERIDLLKDEVAGIAVAVGRAEERHAHHEKELDRQNDEIERIKGLFSLRTA